MCYSNMLLSNKFNFSFDPEKWVDPPLALKISLFGSFLKNCGLFKSISFLANFYPNFRNILSRQIRR